MRLFTFLKDLFVIKPYIEPKEFGQPLLNQMKLHEDTKESAYQDSLGYWTIGVGRLIDARKGGKLSPDEIDYLLTNDLHKAHEELTKFPWYNAIDNEVRKDVLVELAFNMGVPHLLEFTDTIKAIENKQFGKACDCLRASLWAKQVKANRVNDICYRLMNGAYK